VLDKKRTKAIRIDQQSLKASSLWEEEIEFCLHDLKKQVTSTCLRTPAHHLFVVVTPLL